MVEFKFRAFVMYVVLLVTFLGLINLIFKLHKFAFIGEFLVLLALMLIGIISAFGINHNMRWAWVLATWFFGFVFIDMAFVYWLNPLVTIYFYELIAIVIAGFFIAMFSIEKERREPVKEIKKLEEYVASEKKSVEKTFKPGKYIASRTGAKFHSPKCDWAKKVKKENAVWFDNKEDALKAGYKADECVR